MKVLALDTSSGQCSAALLIDGRLIQRAVRTAREHARLILPMVDELLAESGLPLRALDLIAFGRGPGSFTGLRIAAGVTQGLAFGADLPVLPVSSLRALAEQARRRLAPQSVSGHALACMDARMGEVYWASYFFEIASGIRPATPEQVCAPAAVVIAESLRPDIAAGKGLEAYPGLPLRLELTPARCLADAEPDAADIARLAAADLASGQPGLPAEAAQPVYLRDRVAKTEIERAL
jgi:tRNA threonylcarbamoyladenosine biosynthesis protein TsaB